MNNNTNNRGSEIKDKISGKVAEKAATAVGGPLAGMAAKHLGKQGGNSDLINKNMKSAPSDGASEGASSDGLENADGGLSENTSGATESAAQSPLSTLGGANNSVKASGTANLGDLITNYLKKHSKKIILYCGGFFLAILLVLVIIIGVVSIGSTVIEFFTNIGDAIVGFFEQNNEEQIKKYYDKLDKVQEKAFKKKNVCIDVNLITATLTVDMDAFDYITQSTEEVDDSEEGIIVDNSDPASFDNFEDDDYFNDDDPDKYNKMTKEVEILANMQIKTIKYGHDTNLIKGWSSTGIGIYNDESCRPEDDEGEETEVVTEENLSRFDLPGWDAWRNFNTNGTFVSDSPIEVAKHDKKAFNKFFSKKAKEETNYEFTIYSPKFYTVEDPETGTSEQKCDYKLPKKKYVLSIGDITTRKDSVYYWNLVNSFIPNYYGEYLPPEEGPARDEAIEKIAEQIYLLYTDLGPSHSCNRSPDERYDCDYGFDDSGEFDSKIDTKQADTNVKVKLLECTDLSTAAPIAGEELVPLEKYVTGVVYAELGGTKNLEAQKAQAVAARTYLFHRSIKETGSDGIVMKIRNCTKDQVYCDPDQGCWSNHKTAGDTVHSGLDGGSHPYAKPSISSDSQIRKASLETVGEILVDKDGNIVKVGYNSTTQHKWMDSTGDYRSMLMSTYAEGYDLYSNCVARGGTVGDGTQIGPITGQSSCPDFFDQNSDYWGWTGKYNPFVSFGIQCTWYAFGRSLQILHEDFGMSLEAASNLARPALKGNAGQWWENNLNAGTFSTSAYGDVDGAREGAVVVWGDRCGQQYGHVGVVEHVERDASGKVVSATFSEGNWKDANGNKIPCVISTKGRQQILTQNRVDNGCRYLKGFIYLTSG